MMPRTQGSIQRRLQGNDMWAYLVAAAYNLLRLTKRPALATTACSSSAIQLTLNGVATGSRNSG
jgi:phosphoenolpyruvate carboxylase